jgi:Uma2 family endonuclease
MSILSSTSDADYSSANYAWEVATLFPEQGSWTEEAYLALTDGTNRKVEFTDGRLEFLPMPTELHQALVGFLYHALLSFVTASGQGLVPFPPLRVRVHPGRIREPDVLFLRKENYHLRTNRVWNGADLVMEVVSADPKDRQRDYEEKLADYAAAGISEYWIIDADRKLVSIFSLAGGQYSLSSECDPSATAKSIALPGFAVEVAALFQVADDVAE